MADGDEPADVVIELGGSDEEAAEAEAYLSSAEYQAALQQMQSIFERSRSRKVKVDQVVVDGLKRTRTWVMRKWLQPVMQATTFGEVMERSEQAQRDLVRLGIFRDVNVTVDSSPDTTHGDAVNVAVDVEEGRLITGNTGVSVGNNEGDLQMQVNVNNLFGIADRFFFKTHRTTHGATSYDVGMHLPVGSDNYYPFTFEVFKANRKLDQSSHHQTDRGFAASYRTYSEVGQHDIRYELAWREVHRLFDKASFAVREHAGHSVKSSITHTLELDLLDRDMFYGGLVKLRTEVAGCGLGGDVNFVKNDVSATWKMPVLDETCELVFGLRAGLIHVPRAYEQAADGDDSSAPDIGAPYFRPRTLICDRFFLGGAGDVRGFSFKGLGPHAREDSLGGDAFWAAGVNLYFPFPYRPWAERFGRALRSHVFLNAGSLTTVQSDEPLAAAMQRLQSTVAAAAGFGVAISTAMCDFELNYCIPIRWAHGEQPHAGLQFGVGFSFL